MFKDSTCDWDIAQVFCTNEQVSLAHGRGNEEGCPGSAVSDRDINIYGIYQ